MERPSKVQRIALAVTKGIGSPLSIFLHTIVFAVGFATVLLHVLPLDTLLLILNTIVSLEAIYLALFIQMTVNLTTAAVKEVGEDIEGIQEDMGEIQEDIEEISEDVDELQEDVEEISEDVGEISEDVEEINEDDAEQEAHTSRQQAVLATIQSDLKRLMEDIEKLKNEK